MSFTPLASFVTTHPEMFDAGGWRSQGIGSAVDAQNAVAAVPTGGFVHTPAPALFPTQSPRPPT